MSESEKPHTHLPASGATIQYTGYHFLVSFAPAIRLDRKAGCSFAALLAEHVEPEDVDLTGEAWTFSTPVGATANSRLTISVLRDQIQVEAFFPTDSPEWFETRTGLVLRTFGAEFKPKAILQTGAMVRGRLQIDGDAREYLANHVMHVHKQRVAPLGRPVHLIGLRLFLPPYQEQGQDKSVTVDWHVNVKAESALDDPSKLFLEADAQWPFPLEWSAEGLEKVLDRLRIVKEYLDERVMAFLQREDQSETEEEG